MTNSETTHEQELPHGASPLETEVTRRMNDPLRSQRRKRRTMWVHSYVIGCLLAVWTRTARAQVGGICSCSPSIFNFRLDLSLTCPPVNLTKGPGIKDYFCTISKSANVTDVVPVSVDRIDLLELDLDFDVMDQTEYVGSFNSGTTFNYTSVAATGAQTVDDIPGGLQIILTAQNAAGEQVQNLWILAYTNNCSFAPVFDVGSSIGWVVFEDGSLPPREELCTAVQTTPAPTFAPTVPPAGTQPPTPITSTEVPTFLPSTAPPIGTVAPSPSPAPVAPTPDTLEPTPIPSDLSFSYSFSRFMENTAWLDEEIYLDETRETHFGR